MTMKRLYIRGYIDVPEHYFDWDDPEEMEWLESEVLGGEMQAHSNEIGDSLGRLRIVNVERIGS